MFSEADVAQFESMYGVRIMVDTTNYRLIVRGNADAIRQSRGHLMSIKPAGLTVEFVDTVGIGAVKQQVAIPINFNGLWRSTKDEPKCLLQVFEWQIGSSCDSQFDELKIKAYVVKGIEGGMYPRVIELMLPKRSGVIIEVDTWWYPSVAYQRTEYTVVELSGKVYGPPPLSREYFGELGSHVHGMASHTHMNIMSINQQRLQHEMPEMKSFIDTPLGLPYDPDDK